MSEFKQIPHAPLYEIDKDGYIQTIKKKSQILPYPLGSKTVKLIVGDGVRKPFNVDNLIAEAFNTKPIEKPKGEVITTATGLTGEGADTTSTENGICNPPENMKKSGIVEKIMALDTMSSVKMWKLHEAGLKNSEIAELIGFPNSVNVPTTIEKYKKKESLRKRADKVKV